MTDRIERTEKPLLIKITAADLVDWCHRKAVEDYTNPTDVVRRLIVKAMREDKQLDLD